MLCKSSNQKHLDQMKKDLHFTSNCVFLHGTPVIYPAAVTPAVTDTDILLCLYGVSFHLVVFPECVGLFLPQLSAVSHLLVVCVSVHYKDLWSTHPTSCGKNCLKEMGFYCLFFNNLIQLPTCIHIYSQANQVYNQYKWCTSYAAFNRSMLMSS